MVLQMRSLDSVPYQSVYMWLATSNASTFRGQIIVVCTIQKHKWLYSDVQIFCSYYTVYIRIKYILEGSTSHIEQISYTTEHNGFVGTQPVLVTEEVFYTGAHTWLLSCIAIYCSSSEGLHLLLPSRFIWLYSQSCAINSCAVLPCLSAAQVS